MQKNLIKANLHPLEMELINKIRNKYQWGEIIIECRDGLPQRVAKTTTYEKLQP